MAADVLGYEAEEARAIGHAVAVLYAIRAQRGGRPSVSKHPKKAAAIPTGSGKQVLASDELGFGGDSLPCEFDDDGRVLKCFVGCQSAKDKPQTSRTYNSNVEGKIAQEYLDALSSAMKSFLSTYKAAELGGRLIYRLYDQWKKECKAGRRVDMDQLLEWLAEKTKARKKRAA